MSKICTIHPKILLIPLLLAAALYLTSCREAPPAAPAAAKNEQIYGVIETALPDYHLPPLVAADDQPQIFEADGHYGFQDKDGQILVPARYDGARSFDQGYGQLYQNTLAADGTTVKQWYVVSPTGQVAVYDQIRGFFQEHTPAVSAACQNGRWGLLNTEFEPIIPFEYDLLTAEYDASQSAWVSYGQKDQAWVRFDLQKGTVLRYEPYDPSRKALYTDVLDISQYPLAIVDGVLVVNGQSDFLGSRFPLILLDGLTFDLYQDLALASTQPLKLTAGLYEGEWQFTPQEAPAAASHYFAVPHGDDVFPRPVTRDEDHAQYAPAVEAFLRDNAIENTPYVISTVLTGDFLDNGQTGAIVAAADSPLNSEAQPYRDQIQRDYWPPEKFAEERQGIFTAVLYFPDCRDLTRYEVLRSTICQESDIVHWVYDEVIAAAQLYGDAAYEVILYRDGYEFTDTVILDLAAFAQGDGSHADH